MQEIFADPTPVRGLPASEFIEIRNRSAMPVNLRNWTLRAGNNTGRILVSFSLLPDSTAILCSSASAPSYQPLGTTIVVSSFPSLNNEGDTLALADAAGKVVHGLSWDKSWYGNSLREEGGWSLEMKDLRFPCAGAINWTASNDPKGGTPGKANNTRSLISPSIPQIRHGYLTGNHLFLQFDAPVNPVNASITGIPDLQPTQQQEIPPLFNALLVPVGRTPDTTSLYTFRITGLRSCEGTLLPDTLLPTGLLQWPKPGELIISELLFNPPPGGSDFIELFNNSNRVLDAGTAHLANRSADGRIANVSRISPFPIPLLPGRYLALTPDTSWLRQRFRPPDSARLLTALLPSFPDDKGHALLLNSQGSVLDELPYLENWHAPLISNKEGISLERLTPQRGSHLSDNWYSAAGTAGFGTPGYRNSQHLTPKERSRNFTLSAKIITPDQDGRDDFLLLDYQFPAPGSIIRVRIFDETGRQVNSIANNVLGGRSGHFRWDGTNEKGMIVRTGFYVLLAEAFHPDGQVYRFREAVALYKK